MAAEGGNLAWFLRRFLQIAMARRYATGTPLAFLEKVPVGGIVSDDVVVGIGRTAGPDWVVRLGSLGIDDCIAGVDLVGIARGLAVGGMTGDGYYGLRRSLALRTDNWLRARLDGHRT